MPPYSSYGISVLFLLLATLAWASSVFALPGNWIALLFAILYGWYEGFESVNTWVIAAGISLAGAGELLEFLSSYLGVKKFGGERLSGIAALFGAIAGAILGASFLWGIGAIPGTVIGAFAGAFCGEVVAGRRAGALKSAWGAALGRAAGLSAKLGLGGIFLALVYIRVIGGFFTRPIL